jgi:hypothetical protein
VVYTIYYDNDGAAQTTDTAYIIDYLAEGVAFDTVVLTQLDTCSAHTGDAIVTQFLYNGTWLDSLPYNAARSSTASRDTIWAVEAVRFKVPEGIGSHGSGSSSDSPANPVADDSLDTDAGYIKFRVRIR